MPFIDVFSLLNTFLLMSAAFLTFGILEVQVPFFAPPPKTPPPPPERTFEVNVDMEPQKIEVVSKYSMRPINEKTETFDNDEVGIAKMHKYLYRLRRDEPKTDKITLLTDENVNYKNITEVLDAIKLLREDEQFIPNPDNQAEGGTRGEMKPEDKLMLYPKVVMGSVIL